MSVELTWAGAGSTDDLPEDASGDITYEIRGGEDPIISTIEFEGSNYTKEEESVSTKRSSDKLTVKVTDVEVDSV